MAVEIKPKRTSTPSKVPTTSDLSDGELAVNTADQKIYVRDGMSIVEVASVGGGGGGSGMVLKQQVFTSSGTFTPSAELLAAGGSVEVLLVGGGGSGFKLNQAASGAGGSGGCVKRRVFTVTTPVSVTVGAGGAGQATANTTGNAGGTSTFGSLLSAKGGLPPSTASIGAASSGEGSGPGGLTNLTDESAGAYGFGRGGRGGYIAPLPVPAANTGAGSTGGNNTAAGPDGSAGICIVTWWENAP